jgi:exodeoxyribonuclease V beta subunit
MEEHAYPLQAIFYQVVLHRYLSSRFEGYQPELHLGPALYLFVRGVGTVPGDLSAGICTFEIPSALVDALSSLLARNVEPW